MGYTIRESVYSDERAALSTNGIGASNVLLWGARGVVEGVARCYGLGIAVSLYFYFQTFIRLIPIFHPYLPEFPTNMAGIQGFEPRLTESKSVVLPLHHIPSPIYTAI